MSSPWWCSLIIHFANRTDYNLFLLQIQVLLGLVCRAVKLGSLIPLISEGFIVEPLHPGDCQNFEIGIGLQLLARFFDFGLMFRF